MVRSIHMSLVLCSWWHSIYMLFRSPVVGNEGT